MTDIFSRWTTKIPKYSSDFQYLFDSLSNTGGGSTGKQINFGKHFGNNYEFYIYCFFLGLYKKNFTPIDESVKKNDFNYAIQNWGNKTNVSGRKDFSSLQENIFAALVVKTEFNFIQLEKGQLSLESAVRELMHIMEAYTNGGLILVSDYYTNNPHFFNNSTAFLNLILPA